MSLVPSLLQAIVRVDGEALVMHAGDKPYVVAPTGQVELANRGLTLEAVNGIVGQLLPAELRAALDEFGAVQYELPAMPEFPGEHFTVVAARGGDDVWTEIRRRRVPEEDRVPQDLFGLSASAAVASTVAAAPVPPSPPVVMQQPVVAPPVTAPPVIAAPQHVAVAPPSAVATSPRIAASGAKVAPATSRAAAPSPVVGGTRRGAVALVGNDGLSMPGADELFGDASGTTRHAGEEVEIDLNAELDADDAELDEPSVWQPMVLTHVAPPVAEVPAPQQTVAEQPIVSAPPPAVEPLAPPVSVVIEEVAEVKAPPIDVAVPPPPVLEGVVAPPVIVAIAEIETPPIEVFAPPPVAEAVAPPPVMDVPEPVAEVEASPIEVVAAPVAEAGAPPPVMVAPEPVQIEAPPIEVVAPPPVMVVPEPVADVEAPPIEEVAPPRLAEAVAPPPVMVAPEPVADVEAPAIEIVAPLIEVTAPPPAPAAAPPPMKMVPNPVAEAETPPIEVVTPPPAPEAVTMPPVVAVSEPVVAAAAPPPVVVAPPPLVAEAPPVTADRRTAPAATPDPTAAAPTASRWTQNPAIVLPISRNPIRSDQPPPPLSDPTMSGLERLLRVSAARGASALYLSSGSRPSVRVDSELQMLDGEPVHVARDVESLLLTLMPERSHEALRTGAATEWICDIEGVGRVRCMSFRDHLGPGGVFRLMPTRSTSADHLGLPHQVQSLAMEPEGLVLVAGTRSSGKRTLMAAFVDLMNRTRRDHVITIEREINIVHERGHCFISQREVRGGDDEMLAAARSALREDPDVLVVEDLRTGPLMNVALEAAASGRLVVGGFSAHTAAGAIDRIIDLYAPEHRRQVQLALADSLRGVIVQALLRKIGGGRLPAREVLLNTPAVSSVIAEGKTSQLPMAIEGGRRYGMMPLNDALIGLVQNGTVEAREAYRQSPDRPGFLDALNRHGIDTSFVERLA